VEVNIDEIVSNVHLLDDEALLSPLVLRRIVETVLAAVGEREAHRQRVAAEQRITSGVAEEQRGSEPWSSRNRL
jgi:hypothetical protein